MNAKSARMFSSIILGIALAANGHAQSFLTNGLVAYYPLNGNANDASGNGNNGTIIGNPQLAENQFGTSNSAYFFPLGTNLILAQNLNVNINGGATNTVSLWMNWAGNFYSQSDQGAIAFEWGGNSSIWFQGPQSFTQGVRFGIGGLGAGALFGINNGTNFTNTWTHVVAVFVNGDIRQSQLFINGNPVNCALTIAPPDTTISQSAQTTVGFGGSTPNPGRYNFLGSLDDIRIYNRGLSSNEVAQLYAYESAPVLNVGKAVYLNSSNLWVGTNYQVQLSSDAVNWTNYGTPFAPTNSTWSSSNYWNVADWNQLFFRLQVVH